MELIVSGAKGVDVRIATDMISLAWANNYDIAVLISSDPTLQADPRRPSQQVRN